MLIFLYPFLLKTACYLFKEKKEKQGENCTTADPKKSKHKTTATSNNIFSNWENPRMLPGVDPVHTGARCAGNHRKPRISAACVPASSPSPSLPHPQPRPRPRADIWQRSYGAQALYARQTPQIGQSGRDVKLQSNQKKEGATLFEPPDFAALSQPRNVGVGESAPPAKKWTRRVFPSGFLSACVQIAVRQATGPAAPAKTQVAGSAERRNQPGAGRRWRSTHTEHLGACHPQGSQSRIFHAPPERGPASLCGGCGRSLR